MQPWHGRGIALRAGTQQGDFLAVPPSAGEPRWVDLPAEQAAAPCPGCGCDQATIEEGERGHCPAGARGAGPGRKKRIAVMHRPTAALARRGSWWGQHLERWNIAADDSAGQPLALTTAGRLIGLLAETAAPRAPIPAIWVGASPIP